MSICSLRRSRLLLIAFLCPVLLAAESTLEFWRIAYATQDEIAIVAQTETEATLSLELSERTQKTGSAQLRCDGHSPIVLKVGGLSPNTRYRLTLKDNAGTTLAEGSATTAPLSRTNDTITIAFAGEIPTLTDLSSLGLFSAAVQITEPDLICWLRNGLSPDSLKWTSETAYRKAALAFAQNDALSLLGESFSQLSVFSPTDYGPLGSSRHWSGRKIALENYRDFWPTPLQPFPDTPGVFQARYGDVELLALDPLSQRDGFETDPLNASVFSREQLDWLINALATSDATFKLILSPSSLLHPRNDEASLTYYRRAKENLQQALREPPSDGILIVSGSDGPGELTRFVRPDGYPLFELSVGHLLHLSEAPALYPEDNYFRVPGTLVREPHYTTITISGEINFRLLQINFHRLDGTIIRSELISATDLRN